MAGAGYKGFLCRRLIQAVLIALGASVVAWGLMAFAPGDPALRIAQAQGREFPDPIQVEEIRSNLGLDRPLPVQYLSWLGRVLKGDLSISYRTGRPVFDDLAARLPATLILLGAALTIALAVSLTASCISVSTVGRWPDRTVLALSRVGASVPSFLVGLLILQFVVVQGKVGKVLTDGDLRYLLMPALALAAMKTASWTQLLRANMLEAMEAQYSLVARSRGAGRFRVMLRYGFPNALLPFLAAVGMSLGAMIGGSPVIESIFTWPGIGSYVLQAISARDFPVVQGFVMISGLSYVLAGTLVDSLAAWVDPRVEV